MLPYLSKTQGIGGRLKESPEDFVVEEVPCDGKALAIGKRVKRKGKGSYTHFILEKRNWNTAQALKEIAWRLGVGGRRLSCAGTKDRVAHTAQLCSAWEIEPERLLKIDVKDVRINGAWKAGKEIAMGNLLGNKFTITVRGAVKGAGKHVAKIKKELGGRIPNYFGEQRFGSTRANTHVVGKLIVLGDLESAMKNYLCFAGGEENPEARSARERLAKEKSYMDALDYFPQHLKYERTAIRHLADFKNDYAGAFRKLPRGVSLMFVHAYQSLLFNELLALRIREGRVKPVKGDWACPAGKLGFPDAGKAKENSKGTLCLPLIGYESEGIGEEGEALLRREGISREGFRLKSLPELSARGGLRPAFVPLKGFSFAQKGGASVFKFMLPPGAYATVAMHEFMDEKVVG